jgi:glucokinase
MARFVGVDLGGTKIAAAVLDTQTEQIVSKKTILTQAHLGPDAVIDRIADLCAALCESNVGVEGVGLGVPGTIDYRNGLALELHNLPGDWGQRPVAAQVAEHIQVPVWLIVDAHAFALAEANLGAGRGGGTVACFTLGTGIGGGIAIDGKLHLGVDGFAAFFGHQTIDVNGLPDGSGTPGTMEGFASGPAIASLGIKYVQQGVTTRIRELVDCDISRITPETIMHAAQMGDPIGLEILDYAGKHMAAGIANVITILAPHRIVIGGGVAKLGEWIMRPIRKYLAVYSNTVPPEKYQVVIAVLGDDAGPIGAALWAVHQYQADSL